MNNVEKPNGTFKKNRREYHLISRIMKANTNWNLVLIKRKLTLANTIKGLLKGQTNIQA